jgi:tellurite resistance-related uncharacterized protein
MPEAIPEGAMRIEVSATYNRHTIPRELLRDSSLAAEVWGKVVAEEGELVLRLGSPERELRVTPAEPAVIPPQTSFRLADAGRSVLFRIEYFHEAALNDPARLATELGGRQTPAN